MPHDPALEAHEHAEHAEHAEHEHDNFTSMVTLTIAVLAVLAATAGSLETVEAGGAITSASEAVLAQDKATDSWGFSNSKSVRKNLYLIAQDLNPSRAADYLKSQAKNAADEDRSREEATKLEKERDTLLAQSRKHEHRHHWLTAAATLLEVGIAICTVAIITKKRLFWIGSLILAAGGLGLLGFAYLG